MKKSIIVILCALLAVSSAFASGNNERENENGLVKVKLGYMPNLISASLAAIGDAEGYFEEYGLDAELVKFTSGPPEFAAMAAGDLDAGIIGHGAHLLAIQGQAEIFYFECLGNSDKVMTRTDTGIRTAEDLKGKTIAAVLGTSSEALLNLTLQSAGLTQDDVKIVSMDQNGAATALIAGQVDAAAIWSPLTVTVSDTLGENAVVVSSIGDFADKAPSPGSWITSAKMIENHPEVIKALTKAFLKANNFRAANIEKTAEYVAALIGTDTAEVMKEIQTAKWFTADEIYEFVTNGSVDEWYSAEQQMFIDAGQLSEKVPNETYFDKSFIIECYEEMKANGEL